MQSSEVHIILQSCEKKRLDPPKRPTVRTHRFPKKTTFHWWVQGITFKIHFFFIGGSQDSQTKPEICPQIAGGDIIESFIKICLGPGTFFKESGISSKGCFPFCAIEQSKNHMLHSKSNKHTPWNDAILKIKKKNTSDKSNPFRMLAINLRNLSWVNHLRQLWTKQDESFPSSWSRTTTKEIPPSLPTKMIFSREFGWNFPRV